MLRQKRYWGGHDKKREWVPDQVRDDKAEGGLTHRRHTGESRYPVFFAARPGLDMDPGLRRDDRENAPHRPPSSASITSGAKKKLLPKPWIAVAPVALENRRR